MSTKIIEVKKDQKTDDHYFDLKDFDDIIDISLVSYYSLEKTEKGLIIYFYDKDKQRLIPRQNNKA